MPYPNEHAFRLKDPKQYDRFARVNDKFGSGIHAIFGIKNGKSELQSIHFDASKFTFAEAKKWISDHGYKPILSEAATGKSEGGTQMPKKTGSFDEKKVLRTMIGKRQERIFTFERGEVNEDARTVALSFSSEEPGERWYGFEILDHQPKSVRLARMNDGGALLFNHKTDNHIGTIEPGTARIDTDSRKGRAVVRFGKGVLASEKFQDVKDRILRNVSVGYLVHKIEKEKEEEGMSTYRVSDWEPLEISFAPVPMDATVGVGRNKEEVPPDPEDRPDPEPKKEGEEKKMDKCAKCGTPLVDGVCQACARIEAREKEVGEILAVGKKFGKEDEASIHIKEGKSLAEFKDAVLNGMSSMPAVIVTKDEEDKVRAQGFPTFGGFLQAVARAETRGATPDKRLVFDRTAGISGSSEVVPSDGGFLLQDTFSNDLLNLTHEAGILYPKCKAIPIGAGSNGFVGNVVDESSRATGSRFGGVQVYRDPEGQDATAKKPKMRQINMKLLKLHGLWYATDEILQDATQLEAIGKTAFSEEMAFVCDNEIIRGTGAGEMLGILNAGCLVSIDEETSQADDTILSDNILKMYAAMPARSLARAEWYYNTEAFPQLSTMYVNAGVGGSVSFLPPGGLSGTPYGSLMGRPLVPIEQASALGDVGDLIFADLSQYLIIEKGKMEAAGSIHVRFIYDEMCFKFTWRNNGQPIPKSAVAPFKGSVSKSPFVALAAR